MRWRLWWDTLTFGPLRRRRELDRPWEALDRLAADRSSSSSYSPAASSASRAPGPRDWSPVEPAALTTGRRTGRGLLFLLLVVLSVGCVAAPRLLPAHLDPTTIDGPHPPAGHGPSTRVLPAVVPPPGAGGYMFMAMQQWSDDPVTYDPCRELHYVISFGAAPPGAQRVVESAAAEVSKASGIKLVYDGPTDERPVEDRAAFQPDRYGARWAPVLIAWTSPAEIAGLSGTVAGLGGSTPMRDTHGHLTYVTGEVSLDSPTLLPGLERKAAAQQVRAVVMHELSHVLGLDHVSDESQLMFKRSSGQVTFGGGDRRGLAAVGAGRCVPRL